jgi:hypothetical protein
LDRYSVATEKIKKNQIMNTHKACDVIPLFPDQDNDAEITGWDPYIFSILAGRSRAYQEERRRVPRPVTASRRRALLLATRRKSKPKNR